MRRDINPARAKRDREKAKEAKKQAKEARKAERKANPGAEDIDPNILACEADLERLVAAVELCRRIGASDALRGDWGAVERYPGPDVSSPEEIRRYVRDTAITYHHQVGTCKMGLDEAAVVDPRLRVNGIDGLRVGDASVMPTVTTGNTNAPSIMIGERVADFVVGERQGAGSMAAGRVA